MTLLECYHLRINSGLLVIFIPLAIIYTLVSVIRDYVLLLNQSGLRFVLMSGFVVLTLMLLYLLLRGGVHKLMGRASLIVATVLILAYAYISPPPHFEILAFIVVPMVGSHLLSRQSALLISLAVGGVLIAFVHMNPYLENSRLSLNYVWFYASLTILQLYLMNERAWLDRNRALAAAQEADDSALFVQYLPALAWKLDTRRQVTLRNQQALASSSAVEALRIIQALIEDKQHREAIETLLRTGDRTSFEHRWGDTQYRTYLRPIWQDHVVTGAIGLTIDISDLMQELEQHFQQGIEAERKRVLTDFMNDATHDLRTPLSVIHTNMYLMEKATDPEKIRVRREMLKGSISQLEEMLQSMFVMTRLDLLPRFIENEIDVNAVVMESVGQISRDAYEKQLRLESELGVNLPSISGHSSELQMAFYHVLRNAVQHTPQDGVVRLTTRLDANNVVVEIADTGEGISDEALPHIYERFYRGDKARTLTGGRNGMGLAIAKKVVEKHEGMISVMSHLGRGTTFTITLPITPVT